MLGTDTHCCTTGPEGIIPFLDHVRSFLSEQAVSQTAATADGDNKPFPCTCIEGAGACCRKP
jgi:hypothetical protein